jgi:hypothetical protein
LRASPLRAKLLGSRFLLGEKGPERSLEGPTASIMRLFDTGRSLGRQVGIFSRTRPLRIAFIVEDDAEAQENLDAIFSYAYKHWGGKRLLVVPASSGAISERYWNWLNAYDPDIVYSYCSLSDALVKKIDGTICPFQISEHKRPMVKVHLAYPDISVGGLSSLSVLPALLARSRPGDERPTKILGFYDHRNRDPFIADSFGGDLPLNPSLSPALKKLLEPLAIVAGPERTLGIRPEDQIVESAALLSRMTSEPTLTLAQLSGVRIPEQSFGFQRWSTGLNIVVGDSFVDRVCFWNGRLLVRSWEDRGFSALRIPRSRLQDEPFVDALCRFLNKVAWQLPGGWSGRASVFVRSHSVPLEELTNLVDRLRTVARCSTPPPEAISGLDTCCPTEDFLKSDRGFFREEHRQYVSNTKAHVEVPAPTHLDHIEPSDTEFLIGSWMVDRKIERHDNLSVRINVSHWWRLPKRLELAQSFIDDHAETKARVIDEGLLAHTATSQQIRMIISLPEDEDIFSTILYRPAFVAFNDRRHEAVSKPVCSNRSVSDKGQYLTGAAGRFGGIWEAYGFVQSRFWRRVFMDLAGRSPREKEDERLVGTLKKRLKGDRVEVVSEDQWRSLASVVRSEARQIRIPWRYARFESLYERWLDDLAAYLSATPSLYDRLVEMMAGASRELEESLESLCACGVFTQGFEFRCKSCGHRNTHSVDTLTSKPECSLCGRATQLPVKFDWHFFLHASISESIREHGTLSQIWALGALLEGAHDCFCYLPPQKLLLTGSDRPSEIDLFCILDGKLIIGEVKPSSNDFDREAQESLCKLARALNPDVVILSCIENQSKALDAIIVNVKNQLQDMRCEIEGLVPQGRFFDGDIYLPS